MNHTEQKLIAVRLDPPQLNKLEQLVRESGWNQSEIIRLLIDNAMMKPPVIMTIIEAKKPVAV